MSPYMKSIVAAVFAALTGVAGILTPGSTELRWVTFALAVANAVGVLLTPNSAAGRRRA